MSKIIIPLKNSILENEQDYLLKKLRDGLILQKRGYLLYIFEKVSYTNGAIGIDLLPNKWKNLEVTNWKILTSHSLFFSKLTKVYYYSEVVVERFIIDENIVLKEYSRSEKRWSLLVIVPLLLITCGFLIGQMPAIVSQLFKVSLLPLIGLSIFAGVICHMYEKNARNMGVMPLNRQFYVLRLPENQAITADTVIAELSFLGIIKKLGNKNYYSITTSLQKTDLLKEVSSILNYDETTISLIEPGDFYAR